MLQPFIVFEERYISRLIELKKSLLVTQTYKRAMDLFASGGKKCLLVTDYNDPGLAKIHCNAVSEDPLHATIDLAKPVHVDKLISMLKEDSGYKVFWSIMRNAKEVELLKTHIARKYKWNIKNYINNNTNWEVSRDSAVGASVELVFGELYIILKHRNERIRLKLEEIEQS